MNNTRKAHIQAIKQKQSCYNVSTQVSLAMECDCISGYANIMQQKTEAHQ